MLQKCDDSKLEECFVKNEETRLKLIQDMSMAKLSFEVGQEELGNLITEKVSDKTTMII